MHEGSYALKKREKRRESMKINFESHALRLLLYLLGNLTVREMKV